jgi:hypothetical protein
MNRPSGRILSKNAAPAASRLRHAHDFLYAEDTHLAIARL